jgi:hypothetical protein
MNRKPIYYRTHSAIMVFESAQVLAEEIRQRAEDAKACIVKAAHNVRVAEDAATMAALTKRIGAYLRPIG